MNRLRLCIAMFLIVMPLCAAEPSQLPPKTAFKRLSEKAAAYWPWAVGALVAEVVVIKAVLMFGRGRPAEEVTYHQKLGHLQEEMTELKKRELDRDEKIEEQSQVIERLTKSLKNFITLVMPSRDDHSDNELS